MYSVARARALSLSPPYTHPRKPTQVFEAACGIYFPSMGIIKSKYVPEEVRATVYNIFRIPLNFIVVLVLANLKVPRWRLVSLGFD